MKKLLYTLPLFAGGLLLAGAQDTDPSPLQLLEQQAEAGDSVALYRLSYLYETGKAGFSVDSLKADSLLRASARRGYAPAANLLGYRFFDQNPDSMLFWIEKAATAPTPDPKAFNNLGWLLSTGSGGVKKDIDKAVYWLRRGAEKGVPAAEMSLAELYMTSPELAPDSLQARLLLRDAARRGFAPAAERLWLMIEKETEQLIGQAALDEARQYYDDAIFAVATPLLMKAVASEEPYALALLAECYAMGWGVPYDYDHAMHLFWYAARLGDPSAQYIVGETLQQFPDAFKFEEEESASDPQAAARTPEEWLQAAAAQGIPDATAAIERLTPAIMHK